MSEFRTVIFLSVCLLLVGCASFSKNRLTSGEAEIKRFNVQNVRMGSSSALLNDYAQVTKLPDKENGMVVYQVFNPNPQISAMILWYKPEKQKKNTVEHLKKMELRYFDVGEVRTLTAAGGVNGLEKILFSWFGPPSQFGPGVPLATSMDVDAKKAKFNGVWHFTRVHRQLNFIGDATPGAGVAVLTLTDTTPPPASKKKGKNAQPENLSPAASSGPGFSVK